MRILKEVDRTGERVSELPRERERENRTKMTNESEGSEYFTMRNLRWIQWIFHTWDGTHVIDYENEIRKQT